MYKRGNYMRDNNLHRMITVAKMYYEDQMTQDEIAKKIELSIPQVSRIVNAAKKQGYVKTFVLDPFSESNDLSNQLEETFGIKEARIVETHISNERVTQTNAAQAVADYLINIVQTNDIISLAFSNITCKMPQFLPQIHTENVIFVQPDGAVFENVQGYQHDTLRETSLKFDAYFFYVPAPAYVKDAYIRDTLHQDPNTAWVLEKAAASNIAVFSANRVDTSSLYVKNHYFSKEEMLSIQKDGAVGDIFGHFIDKDGVISDEAIESRAIGMPISELQRKDISICVSAGKDVAEAVHATLMGKYCNVLITDTNTAKKVLEIHEES